jgi:hypothetical protein
LDLQSGFVAFKPARTQMTGKARRFVGKSASRKSGLSRYLC